MAENTLDENIRKQIADVFINLGTSWHGQLTAVAFLELVYNLNEFQSHDRPFGTIQAEIRHHTELIKDWDTDWLFDDVRFNFFQGDDQLFLLFLAQTLHPLVGRTSSERTRLLKWYNDQLKPYGYKIASAGKYNNRHVYKSFSLAIEKGKRKALIVGCALYEKVTPLSNPSTDANDMESALKDLGFETMKACNPGWEQLNTVIAEFGNWIRENDIVVFFYAGHGVQRKGRNYMVPCDAVLNDEHEIEFQCVDINRVLSLLQQGRTSVNILILDACRDNPFSVSWNSDERNTGLARMTAPPGTLIAYAASPGQVAFDGDGKNGLYTEAILKHIRTRRTEPHKMFNLASEDVQKTSKHYRPWLEGNLSQVFYFNP